MPFDNPLLAKLFEGILEGREVEFRTDEPSEADVRKAIALLPISLSKQQRNAIVRAWTHEVSYIQGPPGTGKSHTITAIMMAALFLKKRVLLVSHKKPAIDIVYAKLRTFLGPGSVIYASNEPSQRQQMRGELQQQWLANVGTLQGQAQLEQMRQERALHGGKVDQLQAAVVKLEAEISNALEREKIYYQCQEQLDKNRTAYLKQYGLAEPGSLVLSADGDVPRATDVLAPVGRFLSDVVHTKGGRATRSQALHVRRLFAASVRHFYADSRRLEPNLTAVGYLNDHFDLTRDYQQTVEARRRVSDGYIQQTRHTLDRQRVALRNEQAALAKAHLWAHALSELPESAPEVQKFCGMIRTPNQTLIAQRMKTIAFADLIETLPLWVGQMRHLGEFLPFEPELFDLVVVDEASQVNIAEIVPAFYRGSRICVVGDDKQLGLNAAGVNFGFGFQFEELIWTRHFADSHVLYAEADQRSLLVRKHSILDFIRSLDQKVPKTTLDEHFRSLPQLASFTNDTFYVPHGEGLSLMKEVPTNFELECFDAIPVGGVRDTDAKLIQNEVDEVMCRLEKFIRQRHSEHEPSFRAHGFTAERIPTLGVISFLREQRDAILEAVTTKFSQAEIDAFQLLVGTPEEFQGNERDIIFLTLGLAGSESRVNHWEEPRRFNVATSRAIHYTLLIYGGVPKTARLIKSYLTHFGKTWQTRTDNETAEAGNQPFVHSYRWGWNRKLHRQLCESEFEHRVADYLEQFVEQNGGLKRIRLFNQVQASEKLGVFSCGKRLDFVLLNTTSGASVAVEVDGRDHFTADGRKYSEEHLERVEILRRAGWQIVHVPYYRWWRNGWLSDRNDPEFQKTINQFFAELRVSLGLA